MTWMRGAAIVLLVGAIAALALHLRGQSAHAVERCVTCHEGPREGAHVAAACTGCHLGDGAANEKHRAHLDMELEPGALRTVDRTCGTCHPAEAARVRTSLMTTNRGIVGVDRHAFGESATADTDQAIHDVMQAASPSPAQDHLRRLCAGCHLGATGDNRDDAIRTGGSGCGACHSPGRAAPERQPLPQRPHPPVDARVGSDRCTDCHSRSGRISLSYQGLAEVKEGGDAHLPDGRPVKRLTPDVHQTAGLTCVDCHLHTETMGDGQPWRHAREQVEVTCEACHSPASTARWADVKDPITRALLRMRHQTRPDGERVPLGARGTPLWNVREQGGQWVLYRKNDGVARAIPPTPHDLDHTRKGHERLTCAACHATWAPDCRSCHTRFDPKGTQWDFGAAAERPGAWLEQAERYGWRAPALGVDPRNRIAPAVTGMDAHLDARAAGGGDRHVRFFAFLDPHTTTKKARSCESCHVDDPTTRAARFLPAGRPLDEAERRRVRDAELQLRGRRPDPPAEPVDPDTSR